MSVWDLFSCLVITWLLLIKRKPYTYVIIYDKNLMYAEWKYKITAAPCSAAFRVAPLATMWVFHVNYLSTIAKIFILLYYCLILFPRGLALKWLYSHIFVIFSTNVYICRMWTGLESPSIHWNTSIDFVFTVLYWWKL